MISPKSASVNDLTNIMSGQDVKTFFWVFFSKQRHLGPVKMKNAKEEEKRSEKEKSLACMTSKMNLGRSLGGLPPGQLYPQRWSCRKKISIDHVAPQVSDLKNKSLSLSGASFFSKAEFDQDWHFHKERLQLIFLSFIYSLQHSTGFELVSLVTIVSEKLTVHL